PWILPTAEGIPLGELKEESPVVFIPPGLRIPGEVREGGARPPEVGGIEDGGNGSPEPAGPVPPPAPCPPGDRCALHHPLPQWSGTPLDGVGACRSNCGRRHAGVDIQSRKGFQNSTRRGGNCSRSPGRLPCGEAVVAAQNGVVSGITPVGGSCGGIVKVRHSSPAIQTEYLHLARIDVRGGQQVQRGQVLGIEGDERPGRCSFGTHLHYQIRVNGALVNPLNYRHEPPLRAR
ncbi:MAG: M23 family metallopeptidase, partial [Gammaproteobacteria bacterium]